MLAADTNLTSRAGDNEKQPYKVLIMGPSDYWVDIGAKLLRREGLCCDTFSKTRWLTYIIWIIIWAIRGRWRKYDVIYHVYGIWKWAISLILYTPGKPVIWHWIGSDILTFKNGTVSRGIERIMNYLTTCSWPVIHIADSPEIAEELKSVGINASVIRLLPERIEADIKALPANLSVLSYWPDFRKDFYRGDIVLQLAKEFPDVEFKIVAATKDDNVSLHNVKFLGYRKDIEDIYDHSTVLIRLPVHDSLSAMVLEMIARGRYVIYNKKLPGCHFAQNFEESKEALLAIMKLKEPNISGAQFVKENFSVTGESKKLAKICTELAMAKPVNAIRMEVVTFAMRLIMCLLLIPAALLVGIGHLYRFVKTHYTSKIYTFILLCLILPYSLSASSEITSLSNSFVQQPVFSAPIIYDNKFQTECDKLGYKLPIEPNPIAFSLDGRAYIRQKNGVAYMNTQGEWAFASFISAISKVFGQTCSGIDMFVRNDLRIVFDKEGYAYTPVLAYLGKVKHSFLMVKSLDSEQWKAYRLPPGDPRMEWFSGANMLSQPPAVLLYENTTVSLVNVYRNKDKMVFFKIQEVSKNALSIARLGSGGSIVVRSGEWIHAVFAFDISPDNRKGTPEVWTRWSPQKNIQYLPQLLGMSPVFQSYPDSHDYPVVVSDSHGRLHAVLGAHMRPFQYLHTLESADSNEIKWTEPVAIGNYNLTYPELVCDNKDTLHLIARLRSEGLSLVYLKKEHGKDWTKPKKLVAGAPGNAIGYLNCYHRLMKDTNDRLFLTYYVYFNHFTNDQMLAYNKKYPEEKLTRGASQGFGRYDYTGVQRKGPYLLVSEDRGNSWRMAVMNDFEIAN